MYLISTNRKSSLLHVLPGKRMFCRKDQEIKFQIEMQHFETKTKTCTLTLTRKCFISKWPAAFFNLQYLFVFFQRYLFTSFYTIGTKLSIDNFQHIVYKKQSNFLCVKPNSNNLRRKSLSERMILLGATI